ncbi:NUDIX domain-containing protein [Streptomyces sp. LZ34]
MTAKQVIGPFRPNTSVVVVPVPASGRREGGETTEERSRRELREEAGITAQPWRSLGSYAIAPDPAARVHLFEAGHLTYGPQALTPTEEGFTLSWRQMDDAIRAAAEGR